MRIPLTIVSLARPFEHDAPRLLCRGPASPRRLVGPRWGGVDSCNHPADKRTIYHGAVMPRATKTLGFFVTVISVAAAGEAEQRNGPRWARGKLLEQLACEGKGWKDA